MLDRLIDLEPKNSLEVAIGVEIADTKPHSRLFLPILVERHTGFEPDVGECGRGAPDPGEREQVVDERLHALRAVDGILAMLSSDDLGRVERPRASERDERELAQIVAALHGDETQRAQHVRVGHFHHSVGRLDQGEPEALGEQPVHLLANAYNYLAVLESAQAVRETLNWWLDPFMTTSIGCCFGGSSCMPKRIAPRTAGSDR